MAHEIETAAFALEPAWHGLGIVVDHVLTSAEALKLSGLDWTVSLRDLITEGVKVETHKAVVRDTDSSILGVVGSDYVPRQNVESFADLDAVVGLAGAHYESAGSLRGGKQVWLLARLPERLRIAGDEVVAFLLVTTAHDGSRAYRMLVTFVRVACANTLAQALSRGGRGFYARHTKNIDSRIKTASNQVFGHVQETVAGFEAVANQLIETKISDPAPTIKLAADTYFGGEPEKGTKIARQLSPLEAIVQADSLRRERYDEALQIMIGGLDNERNRAFKGTAWGVMNAVSEWTDHSLTYRGEDQDSNRFESILTGRGAEVKQTVLEQLLSAA